MFLDDTVLVAPPLAAAWNDTNFAKDAGLISYGPSSQSVASFVVKILRGEKPAEVAVQTPTKYELSDIDRQGSRCRCPAHATIRADEVIE